MRSCTDMNKTLTAFLFLCFVFAGELFPQAAIKASVIHTAAGKTINNGVILIKDGKIEKVGEENDITIPSDYKVYSRKVATPGLIDARSSVGLSGILNYGHDQDQLEKSDPVQPELRAIDAYNPREELIEWIKKFGTTTVHTGHASGALASGQTMIVKLGTAEKPVRIIDSSLMVSFTLGSDVSSNFKKPGTRAKGVAMLRTEFLKAKEYLDKIKKGEKVNRDLKLEALAQVLKGELTALFTVNKAPDILAAIRLQKEFGFRMVLDGVAEASLVMNEIKESRAPVILHATMERQSGNSKSVAFDNAALLDKEGVLFAIQSGFEGYVPKTRVVLFEAAVALAYGLPFDKALASITINAAKILGIDKQTGSIEPGKYADIVLFDGDPFEYTTHVCEVFIDGVPVKQTCD